MTSPDTFVRFVVVTVTCTSRRAERKSSSSTHGKSSSGKQSKTSVETTSAVRLFDRPLSENERRSYKETVCCSASAACSLVRNFVGAYLDSEACRISVDNLLYASLGCAAVKT